MARIRSTHPGQWADGDFLECSAVARLLVLALRNMADDNGVFRWKPKSIKATCLPADNCDIDDLLSELVENEQVTKFDVDGKTYGAIHNFCKYQKPRKPVAVHPLPDTIAAYVGKTTERCDAKDGTDDAPTHEVTDTSSAKVRTQPPSSNSGSAKDGSGTELSVQREEGGGNRNSSSVPNGTGGKPPPVDWRERLFSHVPSIAKNYGMPEGKVRPVIGKALKLAGDDARAVCEVVEKAQACWPADFTSWLMAHVQQRKETGARRGGSRGWVLPPGCPEHQAWESFCKRIRDERALWKFKSGADVETPTRWPTQAGWNATPDYTHTEAAE